MTHSKPFLIGLCLALGCGSVAGDPDGSIYAPDAMVDALVVTDCSGAPDGASCGSSLFCVSGMCVAGRCGDGFVDPAADEECDDGDTDPGNGCRADCTFTCHEMSECDDRDPCNGTEVCGSSHTCEAGADLGDGTECTNALRTGVCRAGTCAPVGCGDGSVGTGEECEDQNVVPADGCENDCQWTCTETRPCEVDGTVCNGVNICRLSDHVCQEGIALDCDDASPCTADSCDPVLGCANVLIDMDHDGEASDTLGTCGTDCDDLREDVNTHAPELCDSIDHDCNGDPMPAETPVWYVDCDGDGYAASGEVFRQQCEMPAPSTCGGSWTARVPAGGDLDCEDTIGTIHPSADEVVGDGVDQDCNGSEVCYADGDHDGARSALTVVSVDLDCADLGEATAGAPVDCNDMSAATKPGATEVVGDEIDENCDGGETCYVNGDGDGYRTNATVASTDLDCLDAGEARASVAAGDCADGNAAVNPGALEIVGDAGDLDENCDGYRTCYRNADGDVYRVDVQASVAGPCSTAGYAYASQATGDCCDTDARAFPGQTGWFDTPRVADVSLCPTTTDTDFDFNCDAAETKIDETRLAVCSRTNCTLTTEGWAGVPACGVEGLWGNLCYLDGEIPVVFCAVEGIYMIMTCH